MQKAHVERLGFPPHRSKLSTSCAVLISRNMHSVNDFAAYPLQRFFTITVTACSSPPVNNTKRLGEVETLVQRITC